MPQTNWKRYNHNIVLFPALYIFNVTIIIREISGAEDELIERQYKFSQLFAASQASIQSLYTSAGSDRSKREREDGI